MILAIHNILLFRWPDAYREGPMDGVLVEDTFLDEFYPLHLKVLLPVEP
jgi:hypothetical protein